MKLKKGYVQVYTGNGKGKTTAALGLALRAVGRRMMVCMIQFMKGGGPYGEQLSAAVLAPFFTVVQTGRKGWIRKGSPTPEDIRLAREALIISREALIGSRYDLVILDEINNAVHYGLVPVEEVLAIIDLKPHTVELVLTGRYAHEKIIEAADLVTEMREIKHYYRKGVPAREGIEK
ncbi:MAG: cob(I)yrinic acid a,c-diamide adenosyltransferase [Geobacteraceae bacterium]|nr:cob(I)yrinic acid a,c-diamide adenosyltransferase [Geobacteraceae bacterium]